MRYTNKHNLPSSIVEAIKKQTYDLKEGSRTTISVSALNMPPRIRQLQLRHSDELTVDVSDHLWMLMGSAVHEVLSRIGKENRIIEERMTEPVQGIKITGKPDIYDKLLQSIEDYKITSVWAVQNLKTEWEQQLNCYAWFLRKLGYTVKIAAINAILRDWNRNGARWNPDYPAIPFKRLPVTVWSFKKQESYIKGRLQLHLQQSKKTDENLLLCTPEERWATSERFAVIKARNKRATKLFDTHKEAKTFQNTVDGGSIIERRPGQDLRCQSYCPVNKFCDYYRRTYQNAR